MATQPHRQLSIIVANRGENTAVVSHSSFPFEELGNIHVKVKVVFESSERKGHGIHISRYLWELKTRSIFDRRMPISVIHNPRTTSLLDSIKGYGGALVLASDLSM